MRRAWTTGTGAFQVPGFSMLWSASAMYAFAQWMDRTAVGWLVLEQTGSVFLTALAWTVRVAPGMLLGPVAGAVADRSSRKRILAASALLRVAVFLLIGFLTLAAEAPIPLVLALVAVSGVGMTFNITSLQPLIRDIVGPERAMNAVSLNAFGQKAIGALGALPAGILIEVSGVAAAYFVAAAIMVATAVAFLLVQGERQAPPPTGRLAGDIAAGVKIIFVQPLVGLLLLIMLMAENLGFAFNSVLPAIAENVLDAGPSGLGMLGTAVGVGSVLGTLGLAVLGDFRRKGLLLAFVVMAFGGLMIALGSVEIFVLALLVAAGLGAAMAAVDTLEWILLQSAVDEEFRGRAIGAWNIAIGFGWIGPTILGATAEFIGTPEALSIFGIILAIGGLLTLRSAGLRNL
ncbi:MAG: MFS transporter [Dehalococcoidia bacterium]|nr:MFS transporter [Dehalococcoidia bacterium]